MCLRVPERMLSTLRCRRESSQESSKTLSDVASSKGEGKLHVRRDTGRELWLSRREVASKIEIGGLRAEKGSKFQATG